MKLETHPGAITCLHFRVQDVFVEPPSLDERIINQFSLLSMMSSPTAILDEWLEARGDLCYKIILLAKIKWETRDKLDQANINERLLYPGLDGLCRWLRVHPPSVPGGACWYCHVWQRGGNLFDFLCLLYGVSPRQMWRRILAGEQF